VDQAVQQGAGIVFQRVPLVLADLGQLEQGPFHHPQQDRVVHLVVGVQRLDVHLGQRRRGVPEHVDVPGHRLG
jgi:hypothetical protein